MNRFHARRAARAKPPIGIVSQPQPRLAGSFARGKQLTAGNFLFAGHLVEMDGSPFAIVSPSDGFAAALHGFAWLDDLAAVGDPSARIAAARWVCDWIERYGRGTGPGWTPALAGRRMIHWIGHAIMILRAQDKNVSDQFYQSAAQQCLYLSRRWKAAPRGLPRIEALIGLIYASLSLIGMDRHLAAAIAGLETECAALVDAGGAIPSRNPEELLELFTLLGWAGAALRENGHAVADAHRAAIERIGPTIRALRHADGALARFHGGGRGADGRLDWALRQIDAQPQPAARLYMGYGRLSAGRSSVVMDCARPPEGGHASSLAFELTSGRRPVIVNCGNGAEFGEEWHRAGRASPSHSTAVVGGRSSAQIDPVTGVLSGGPRDVPWDMTRTQELIRIEAGQDAWRREFGLTHARTLDLSRDGRVLSGDDVLTTISEADKAQLDSALTATNMAGVPFQLHFHLHPDVNASLDLNGSTVSIGLRSGEIWIFRAQGDVTLAIEPSVYLEKGRLQPRASTQVVLSGQILSYATRITWAFSKAQETPTATRDLATTEDNWQDALSTEDDR